MKHTRRLFALLLTLVMVMSLASAAFAENGADTKGTIRILNPQKDENGNAMTYTAYKIFDVVYSKSSDAYAYTYTTHKSGDIDGHIRMFAAEEDNGLTLTKIPNTDPVQYTVGISEDFNAAEFAKGLNYVLDALKRAMPADMFNALFDETNRVTFTEEVTGLDLGYWLVTPSTTGAVASLTTTNPVVEIRDKNEVPVLDKNILTDELICTSQEDGHSHTTDCYKQVKVNTVSIGEVYTYILEGAVPNMEYFTSYTYQIHDEMDAGIDLDVDSISVRVGDTVLAKPELGTDDHTVTVNGDVTTECWKYPGYTLTVTKRTEERLGEPYVTTSFEIDMKNMLQYAEQVGDPIVVTFDARLNENAAITGDTAEFKPGTTYSATANYNSAYLAYSKGPANDELKTTTKVTTETYTTELIIRKTDGTNPLPGAKFRLEGEGIYNVIVTRYLDEIKDVFIGDTWYGPMSVGDSAMGGDTAAPMSFGQDTREDAERLEVYDELGNVMGYLPASFNRKTISINSLDWDETFARKKFEGLYSQYTPWYELKDGTFTTEVATADNWTDYVDAHYSEADGVDMYNPFVKMSMYTEEVGYTYTAETTTHYLEEFVGFDGVLKLAGLKPGTYTLTEIVTPDGYNTIDPITIEIKFDEETKTFHIEYLKTNDDGTKTDIGNSMTQEVINVPGKLLPTTGGMGTTIFYVVGGLMVVFAGVLLVTKRRMRAM